MKRLSLFILFLAAAGLFSLFSYNSGYGYDALEYLVIGRSLLDGYRLYDFIPSKSWGLYGLTAAFLSTGVSNSHLLVAAITSLILIIVVCVTYGVTRHTHGSGVAVASSLLVVLCSVFMEMNYLEPEGLVAVCGLAAFLCIGRAGPHRCNGRFLLGGLFVGMGFAFKSVAAFYFLAILVFILVQELRNPARSAWRFLSRELLVTAGLMLALVAPLVYFGLTGRLTPHVEWTYLFPLLERPAESVWLSKLFTKLLWFDVLVVAALAMSLRRGVRERVYSQPDSVLALLMGLLSLLALLKQQASHYVFPGAVFLSIFIADVFKESLPLERIRAHRRVLLAVLSALAVLVCGSAWLYNARALQRLIGLRSYSNEIAVTQFIQERVPAGRNAIFFKNSVLLYWLSHRYPNTPYLKMDVQETYALENAPDTLVRALSDPNLALVECDPKWIGIQDQGFVRRPGAQELIRAFLSGLEEAFVLSDSALPPYVFWSRKGQASQHPVFPVEDHPNP